MRMLRKGFGGPTRARIALAVAMAIPVTAQSQEERVPFELRHEFLIVVKGSIGKLANLSFVVDTGATHTMLDERIADKLSLKRQSGEILNFDRKAKMEWADVAELQIGPLEARNVRVMVGDLRNFSEFADTLDGVIGVDILRMSQGMRIDYLLKLVTFKFADEQVSGKPPKPQVFTVKLPVQGQTMVLVLDTGLQGILLYSDRLSKHIPELRLTDKIAPVHQGRLTGESANLHGVQLGTVELQAPVFLIPSAPTSFPSDIDGYLGTAALNAKRVELNFATGTLRLWLHAAGPLSTGRNSAPSCGGLTSP